METDLNLQKCEMYVDGMHCAACVLLIEDKLSKNKNIKNVKASLDNTKVNFELQKDADKESVVQELNNILVADGYKLVDSLKQGKNKVNNKELVIALIIAASIFGVFLLLQKLGIAELLSSDKITLPFVFFIGVIASLSSCAAVVGGLVLSLSSTYAKDRDFKKIILFHLSRLIGFFFLGGLIGIIGSAFILSNVTTFLLNLILFIVMLLMGINLLGIISGTEKLMPRLPKSFGKSLFKINLNSPLAPVILGVLTFILPCGFTQSMQIQALQSRNALNGGLIMFVFALGTLPVLLLISIASFKFSKTMQSGLFFKIAGFIVIFFGIFNFTAALVAIGIISPIFNI